MRTRVRCRAIIVAVAMMASMACGTYRHDKIVHNVLATGWDDAGGIVSLAEVIRLRWDFVGINPPHTYPKTWVERQGHRVSQGTTALPLTHALGNWLTAYARQHERGFVVSNDGPGCRLVSLTGTVTDCPPGAADKRLEHFLPGSDRLLLSGEPRREGPHASYTVYTLDLRNNLLQPLDDAFLELPHVAPEGLPCRDASYRALTVDESTWVVVCLLDGLWLVRRGAEPALLHGFDENVTRPDSIGRKLHMEDDQRPFAQEYGLAWSPDATQVYYCPDVDKQGVLITVATREAEPMSKCLGGAVWSRDGRRIAGTRAGMSVDELVVR